MYKSKDRVKLISITFGALLSSMMCIDASLAADLPATAPDQSQQSTQEALQVPLFALLSNPDKYSGKLVSTQGFMHFRDEDYELYPSREFGNFRLSLDGLWLDFSRDEHKSGKSTSLGINLSALDNQYVTLTGIFDTKVKGRFNFSIGGFRSISKISLIAPDKVSKPAAVTTTSKSVVSNAKK